MKAYEGLSPEQGAAKARGELVESIKGIPSAAKEFVRNVYKAEKDPVKAIKHVARALPGLPQYYWENPDVLATDVAATFTPLGPETEAARATSIPSRIQRLGHEVPRPTEPVETPRPTKAEAGKLIQEPKEAGTRFPASQADELMQDIRATLSSPDYGYDYGTHGKVKTALAHMDRLLTKSTITPEMEEQLDELGPRARAKKRLRIMETGWDTHDFIDLHNARKNLKPALSAGGEQGRMAEMMEEKLDDYVLGLPGGEKFKRGIEQYARAAKLDDLQEIKRKADLSAQARYTTAGWAHSFATELKKIAMNPKKMRLWTPDEREAIEKLVSRKDFGTRVLRAAGRLSVRGPASLGADAVIGHLLHAVIPGGPYGLMAAGELGRFGERQVMESRIKDFEDLVAKGGKRDVQLKNVIGPQAHDRIKNTEAFRQWSKKATPSTTRALAIAIARAANMPQLIPRIESEINGIEQVND